MAPPGDTAINDHLAYLSQRIRGLRAARGMTRKDLAHHAEVSERYLAQLENGKANPSVEVLWRVADAMDVELTSLLSESQRPALANPSLSALLQRMDADEQQAAYEILHSQFDDAGSPAKQGLALVGLRGGGKSTLGSQVAEILDRPFVRLGETIAEIGGMALWEIISLAGQKTYRRLEREALEKVISEQPQAIVEAGGSMVSEPATFDLLLGSFFTVWLRARPEEHMQRVQEQGDTRPMQGNEEAMADLKRILAEREPDYARCDYTLDTRGRSQHECLQELLAVTGERLADHTGKIAG